MLHLQDARLFARVAATGSFSEAARQLDLTPAAVSATLKKLEALWGARLLERSTRSLRLTAEGALPSWAAQKAPRSDGRPQRLKAASPGSPYGQRQSIRLTDRMVATPSGGGSGAT